MYDIGSRFELVLNLNIQANAPKEVYETLKRMVSFEDNGYQPSFDHPLFIPNEYGDSGWWRGLFLTDLNIAYPEATSSFTVKSPATESLLGSLLTVRCNFHEGFGTVENFLDWIAPYCHNPEDEESGYIFGGFIRSGVSHPVLIYFKNGLSYLGYITSLDLYQVQIVPTKKIEPVSLQVNYWDTLNVSRIYSVPEFLDFWMEASASFYELINGRITPTSLSALLPDFDVRSAGSAPETALAKGIHKLEQILRAYVDIDSGEKNLGKIYRSTYCNLGQPKGLNYFEPYICYLVADRIPDKSSDYIPIAPDLIVELWSEEDTVEKIHRKIKAYKQAGVRLIWSINLLDEYILVYYPDQRKPVYLDRDGELDGEDVIPGFRLAVSELFDYSS
jgi:Uma2 family endonuclease